jgi:hypothetical protein
VGRQELRYEQDVLRRRFGIKWLWVSHSKTIGLKALTSDDICLNIYRVATSLRKNCARKGELIRCHGYLGRVAVLLTRYGSTQAAEENYVFLKK